MLVIKRDGTSVEFDISKIENAIDKAFVAVDRKPLEFVTQRLALLAVSKLNSKAKQWQIEDIQDAVEYALVEAGFSDVAKAYILYRQSRSDRRDGRTVIDYKKIIENYVDAVDWRVKENSTVNYSIGGLILNASGAVTANYWLSEVYDKEIGQAHKNGDMHIHDLSMLAPYCFTGDTVVRSLDGKNRTFEQLVKDGVKELWVYAYDHKNQCIVPARAINPRVTRKTDKLIRVKFTGNVEFTCTPDHPIMLRSGEFIKAEDLRTNMSVMPLYVSEKTAYCRINKHWVSDDRQQYLHRWVLENKLGRALRDDEVTHHINGDKHDNRPENLEVMTDRDHRTMEVLRTMETEKWKRNNRARLVDYNKSAEKRSQVSAFASSRPRTQAGTFAYMGPVAGPAYNHRVRSVKPVVLDKPVKVYDLTVPGYENFAVAGGVFVHNCAGWSLKQLIREGLGGVPGKIASAPAQHLSTLCNQMVNFLGIMQNEWAGAQAFSSFDTYLAAFVKKDNLTYKQVKQCIQSFVYGVNTPSRWGCVKDSTQVMTPEGWKNNSALKVGDVIYTWVDGTLHTAKLNNIIRRKNDFGVMHVYKGAAYRQTVSPEHRCIVELGTGRGVYGIKQSMDIFGRTGDLRMPSYITDVDVPSIQDFSDDEIRLAAMYYTDGSKDFSDMRICKSERRNPEIIEELLRDMGLEYSVYRNTRPEGRYTLKSFHISAKHRAYIEQLVGNKYVINPKFMHLDKRQSELFIRTWAQFDGCTSGDRISCQYDNDGIRDALEIIFARAGYVSHVWSRKKATDEKATNYVYAERKLSTVITEREEVPYNGTVWCPNTDDGTAIYRDEDGNIFISGNCQAPFSNITLDWNIPEDLKDVPAIVGGKDQDFTYGDCQKEADMVNKAFIEVMTHGDANGRGFQYPIPTYSITRDFDWSETENNKALFEMAAKYGTPYFSNYVNSDMNPSDVRSMAFLSAQDIIYMNEDGVVSTDEIRHLYEHWVAKGKPHDHIKILWNGKFVPCREMFEIDYSKYETFHTLELANGQQQCFSYDHKTLVLGKDGEYVEKLVQDVEPGECLLLARHPWNIHNGIGTYEAGKILGYYLAEGWQTHDNELNFAINIKRADIKDAIVDFFARLGCRTKVEEQTEVNIFKVFVFGSNAKGFVDQFINGKTAKTKRLHYSIWNTSDEFRQGVFDGYLDTDGCPKYDIFAHTTNKAICKDFIILAASIGRTLKYRVNKKNRRTFKDREAENFTSYELKLKDYPTTPDGEHFIVPVLKNFAQPNRAAHVYNFTVETEKHWFELPNGIITPQCCRLRLDLRDLRRKNGGFFGSGDSTGSVGVVTINMPRIGYLSTSREDFFEKLDNMMDIAARSLKLKRNKINELLEKGLYPYTKRYLGSLSNHFSTIGLVGMNEACLNAKWLGKNMTDPEAQKFAEDVLDHMRERLADYQEMYPGDLYNLEATPAESTAFRLAKHDLERFPDIITSGTPKSPYYTNSTNLPVGYTDDIWKALDVQDRLQPKYTSGTVFHTFLGQRISDWRGAMNLIRAICSNYRLPYISLSPTYSVCPEHGYLEGEQAVCPHCGKTTEVYSRITGYYRAVQNWNPGKVQEFEERKEYVPESSKNNPSEVGNKDSECESCNISDNGMTCEKQHDPEEVVVQAEEKFSKPMLFTTPTCPNCPTAKAHLQRKGIEYDAIDATQAIELVERYGIQSVPTLVADNEVYRGLGAVMGWINRH